MRTPMTAGARALLAIVLLTMSSARGAEPAAVQTAPAPGPIREPLSGMELVFVKGGCFRMGDIYGDTEEGGDGADELPVHEVCLSDFYIGKYEVTQAQWTAVMGPAPIPDGITCTDGSCPFYWATWETAQEFIRKLNARDGGSRYRLPTEAEWEYAARSGGRNERYSGGNDIESVSWYGATSGAADQREDLIHHVGTKAPNGLGIHDMSGNAWELTGDWYDASYYSRSPRDDPRGPDAGGPAGPLGLPRRVKRGGCVSGGPRNSRTSRRTYYDPGASYTAIRLVRTK